MGDIAKHFDRSEFACQCGCGFDTVDTELLDLLQHIRASFDAPVSIESGARCVTHNTNEGGYPESQHLDGRAADIKVQGVAPLAVQRWFDKQYPNRYGLGKYASFTHIDSRAGKARWNG